MASRDLQHWWSSVLTDAQRAQLLTATDDLLPPALALELWRDSGLITVVQPGQPSPEGHNIEWRLAPEVLHYIRELAEGGHDVPDQ